MLAIEPEQAKSSRVLWWVSKICGVCVYMSTGIMDVWVCVGRRGEGKPEQPKSSRMLWWVF